RHRLDRYLWTSRRDSIDRLAPPPVAAPSGSPRHLLVARLSVRRARGIATRRRDPSGWTTRNSRSHPGDPRPWLSALPSPPVCDRKARPSAFGSLGSQRWWRHFIG